MNDVKYVLLRQPFCKRCRVYKELQKKHVPSTKEKDNKFFSPVTGNAQSKLNLDTFHMLKQ